MVFILVEKSLILYDGTRFMIFQLYLKWCDGIFHVNASTSVAAAGEKPFGVIINNKSWSLQPVRM